MGRSERWHWHPKCHALDPDLADMVIKCRFMRQEDNGAMHAKYGGKGPRRDGARARRHAAYFIFVKHPESLQYA